MAKGNAAPRPARGPGLSGFTEELAAEILQRIREGTPPTIAAEACGVARSSFRYWRDSRPDFAASVTRARAEFEASQIESITRAGQEDWRASAWALERRIAARYAIKVKVIRDEEARRLVQVARDVLSEQDCLRLLEALAASDSEGDAGEDEGDGFGAVH